MSALGTTQVRGGRQERLRRALEQLRSGRPVVVSDDAEREDEADLILAASNATAEWVGFLVRHTSGVLCAPMPAERAGALGLPPMVKDNEDPKGTAYAVSCDAVGVGTGIGAAERALTLRTLADPQAGPERLTRPGHVFPLAAHPDGLRGRRGHTEASVELTRLAGLGEVGVIGELVGEDGEVLRGAEVLAFAAAHELVHLDLDDIAGAGLGAWAKLPSTHGTLRCAAWGGDPAPVLWIEAATQPGPAPSRQAPLVRLHSECLTSEALGSLRCDCREQLDEALSLAAAGEAAVLYLRGHEGRGIGLADKVSAYALQDDGADTVEANLALGHAPDERDFAHAASALLARGWGAVRLLSNNPAKAEALRRHGIEVVGMVPTLRVNRPEANAYLETKEKKMGHLTQAARA
jgi:3,4-dihydroxy 2-butanone 4-phosphate synthase / GTP cyclohydrolase II